MPSIWDLFAATQLKVMTRVRDLSRDIFSVKGGKQAVLRAGQTALVDS